MPIDVSTAHRIAPDLVERVVLGRPGSPWPRLRLNLGLDEATCRRIAAALGFPRPGPFPRFIDPEVFERAAAAIMRRRLG